MSEATDFQADVTEIIQEFGEPVTISRGAAQLTSVLGTFGHVNRLNVGAGQPSVIVSEQLVLFIPQQATYTPQVDDVVADTHANLFQVSAFSAFRFKNTNLCWRLDVQ